MNILISETRTNETEKYIIGETDVYETFTSDVRKLFDALQREHGPCKGKVYVDVKGESKAIGWIFHKRERYTDSREAYDTDTWVTLHEKQPEKRIKYNYKYLT